MTDSAPISPFVLFIAELVGDFGTFPCLTIDRLDKILRHGQRAELISGAWPSDGCWHEPVRLPAPIACLALRGTHINSAGVAGDEIRPSPASSKSGYLDGSFHHLVLRMRVRPCFRNDRGPKRTAENMEPSDAGRRAGD